MATIGLDHAFFAPITEDAQGIETYGAPIILAKAISAELSIEINEASLFADDGLAYIIRDFKSGTLTLGVDDIGATIAAALTGARVDENGVLTAASEDAGSPVAIGFRALRPNNTYRYFWLYRVKFGVPNTNLQTKGDSITFQTPSVVGTIMRRNKADSEDKHPWKSEATEGDPNVSATVISEWFTNVYEPVFGSAQP
jgi:phi13 family phage major tail protein